MEKDRQLPDFPIPIAYPYGHSTKEVVRFYADQVGVETKYIHDGPAIEIILPHNYWENLPDENKRTVLKLLAESIPDFLERRRQSRLSK